MSTYLHFLCFFFFNGDFESSKEKVQLTFRISEPVKQFAQSYFLFSLDSHKRTNFD